MNDTKFYELKNFLDEHIDNSSDTSKVDLFPIPCGMGKSKYIRYKISDWINANQGLIVVTDSIDRLNNYVGDSDDEELSKYISRNRYKISVLTNDNVSDELKTLNYRPIILMTTQRFFNLTKEEIQELTTYKHGKRDKIFIDERPYIFEIVRVDISTVDKIDATLHMTLDNNVDQSEKQWLIEQWEQFSAYFKNLIKEYELQNITYQFTKWHNKGRPPTLTTDDKKFLKLIDKYRPNLNSKDYNTYKNILATYQIIDNGATFCSFKRTKETNTGDSIDVYDNYFNVVVDNSDKLVNIGAKVFVFDGTGDILPDYVNYIINHIDCSRFQRTYKHLTIRCVDIPNTSKVKLCGKNGRKLIKDIATYANSLPYNVDVVFSHKQADKAFREFFPQFNNFGNIKGTNKYNHINNIMQVGVFRYPDTIYFDITGFCLLSKNPKVKTTIITPNQYSQIQRDIMYRYILCDIEQNLMRSKIRNVDNNEDCTFTLLFNCKEYEQIIEMLRLRFPLANIEVVDTPTLFLIEKNKSRNTKNISIAQRITDWLTIQPKGRIFKIKEMASEICITQRQFNKAKENNKSLTKIFDNLKTSKHGYYRIE